MDREHHEKQPSHSQDPPASRRKFLRHIGMTAAATAAIAGFADVAGMKPALAATKGASSKSTLVGKAPPGVRKQVQEIRASRGLQLAAGYNTVFCRLAVGYCGAPCHPNGVWCHTCCSTVSCVWSTARNCSTFCVGGEYDFCS